MSMNKDERENRNKQIREGYSKGKSIEDLSAAFNVSIMSIYRVLGKAINKQRAERNQKIKELYSQGSTQTELASVFDLNQGTIARITRGSIPRPLRPLSEKTKAKIAEEKERNANLIEDYQKYTPVRDICNKYKMGKSNLYLILKEMGITPRRRGEGGE